MKFVQRKHLDDYMSLLCAALALGHPLTKNLHTLTSGIVLLHKKTNGDIFAK